MTAYLAFLTLCDKLIWRKDCDEDIVAEINDVNYVGQRATASIFELRYDCLQDMWYGSSSLKLW